MAALTKTQLTYPVTDMQGKFVAASGGGDTLLPGDKTYLLVKNASAGVITVTVARFPATDSEGQAETGLAVSVPITTGEKWIGPLSAGRYMNPATGNVEVTYSGVTSLTVAAVNMV
jgi:hypothetical protein